MFKAYSGFWENTIKKTYELGIGTGKILGIIFLILLVITISLNTMYRKKKVCPPYIFHLIVGTLILGLLALCSFIVGYMILHLGSDLMLFVMLLVGLVLAGIYFIPRKRNKNNNWLDIEKEARKILFQAASRRGSGDKSIRVSLFNYPGSVIVEHDYKGNMYEITGNYRVNEFEQQAILLYKHEGIIYLREFGEEIKELDIDENEYLKEFIKNSKNHVSIYLFGIKMDLSVLDLLLEKKKEVYYFKDGVNVLKTLEAEEINYIKDLLKRDMRFLMTINEELDINEIKDKADLLLAIDDELKVTMEKEGKIEEVELEYYFKIKKIMDKYRNYFPKEKKD